MLFKYLKPLPLSAHLRSRDAYIYMDRSMKLLGFIPSQNGKSIRWICNIWAVIVILVSIIYLPFGFLVSCFTDIKSFTPGDFLSSLGVGINSVGSSIKGIILLVGLWRVRKSKELLDRMDDRCIEDVERIIIHRSVSRCSYVLVTYMIIYYSFTASSILLGVLTHQTPWKFYNPFVDWRESTEKLRLAFMLEVLVMLFSTMRIAVIDVFPLIYGLILRTHIVLLRCRIQNLRSDPNTSERENYVSLTSCISDHKLILEYCDIMRPIISDTLFTQYLLVGVVLGLSLINLLFYSNLWSGLATCAFIMASLLQTFPFCYTCNMIQDDCETLSLAVFQSNWIDADRRYKTTLLYFLHKTQQPIVFTAAGIFTISISSNIQVAKLAFSVVAIVKQLNIAAKFQNK